MVSESAQKLISSVLEVDCIDELSKDCVDLSGQILPHVLMGRVAGLFCEAVNQGGEGRANAILSSIERVLVEYDDEIYELVQVGFLEMVRNSCGLHHVERLNGGKLKLIASAM